MIVKTILKKGDNLSNVEVLLLSVLSILVGLVIGLAAHAYWNHTHHSSAPATYIAA